MIEGKQVRDYPTMFQGGAGTCSTLALVSRIEAGEAASTQAITPDGTQLGFLAFAPGTIRYLALRFTGNAGNTHGQTAALAIYKNGVQVAIGTVIATNVAAPSNQLDTLAAGAVVNYVAGDFIQLALVLSATLDNALTVINASAGS